MSKLNDADRQAVDAILMNGHNPNQPLASAVNENARVNQVANILRLLDLMPTPEPPADLAARTLQRIRESAPGASRPTEDQPRPTLGDQNIV